MLTVSLCLSRHWPLNGEMVFSLFYLLFASIHACPLSSNIVLLNWYLSIDNLQKFLQGELPKGIHKCLISFLAVCVCGGGGG